MVDVPLYVKATFKRTDGSLDLNNNAPTYVNQTIVSNTLGATIRGTSKGQGIKLKRGMYLLVARTQLQTNSPDQWMSIGIISSGMTVLGPGNAHYITSVHVHRRYQAGVMPSVRSDVDATRRLIRNLFSKYRETVLPDMLICDVLHHDLTGFTLNRYRVGDVA